jgi:hypothetical protein
MGMRGEATMFDKIINPSLSVYDGETNVFIGEARFDLTIEAEEKLLQLVNYNKTPSSLFLLNLDFVQPSDNYIPPPIGGMKKSNGILRAVLIETNTRDQLPIEIRFNYDAIARGYRVNNPYLFDSFEFSNMHVQSISQITY